MYQINHLLFKYAKFKELNVSHRKEFGRKNTFVLIVYHVSVMILNAIQIQLSLLPTQTSLKLMRQ